VFRSTAGALPFGRDFSPIEGGFCLVERDAIEIMERSCEYLVSSVEVEPVCGVRVLVVEGAGCAVAADADVLANDLALPPFVVRREDLGDAYLRWTFVARD
jgi:hypothetical protein